MPRLRHGLGKRGGRRGNGWGMAG